MTALQQRCMNRFGSLIAIPPGLYGAPLFISLGALDMEPEHINEDDD
jgi:hypothetical protein